MMEEHNAWEAVRNNAYGTLVVARAAAAFGVGKLVLVSTDKAVNPTNVMGASKRLAELLCQGLANGSTQFVIVRFGNVVGSAGSVIPRFREQIARGGPVTVTHPDITRYFMSLAEAAQLLLQAGMIGRQGEVLVLDMGDPVRIVDLARDLIRLSGEDPDRIGVKFIGLRPGEKLYEEPLAASEPTRPTPHRKLRLAMASRLSTVPFAEAVAWLSGDAPVADEEVRARLARLLPEYAPYVPGAPSPEEAPKLSGEAERAHAPAVAAMPAVATDPAVVALPAVATGPEEQAPSGASRVPSRSPARPLPAPRPAPSPTVPARDPVGAELLVRRVTR
jgi:FlaA1/EpsC-like NDP-sugar epimerase